MIDETPSSSWLCNGAGSAEACITTGTPRLLIATLLKLSPGDADSRKLREDYSDFVGFTRAKYGPESEALIARSSIQKSTKCGWTS